MGGTGGSGKAWKGGEEGQDRRDRLEPTIELERVWLSRWRSTSLSIATL